MKQLGLLNFDAAPFAPQSVTMAPSAREARRSGLLVARAKMPTQLREYLACLKQLGKASDQEIARVLGWALSCVNGRRADAQHMYPGRIIAAGRVQVTHPDGRRTSRTLWSWVETDESEASA